MTPSFRKILISSLSVVAIVLSALGIAYKVNKPELLGFANATGWPFYQSGATTVFQFPISVPSCTGCGGGGSSDTPWYTNGGGDAVLLTTSTNQVAIGLANPEGSSPLEVASATSTLSGQIGVLNQNPLGLSGISFDESAATGSSSYGVGIIGYSGTNTSMIPTSTLLIAATGNGTNGITFVSDGSSPGMSLTNTNNLEMSSGSIYTGADGGFATPSFSWAGDKTTGFWRAGTSVYVSNGGQTDFQWAPYGNYSYVDLQAANNNTQKLGTFGQAWAGVYASSTSYMSAIEANGTISASGGSANHAICWKADGKTLGYCSDVVGVTGTCTCN